MFPDGTIARIELLFEVDTSSDIDPQKKSKGVDYFILDPLRRVIKS